MSCAPSLGLRRARGFTLLEVMVAVAILGLGLTVILSSQAGLIAGMQRVRNETYVTALARCKMSEVEIDLLEDGYSLLDQTDSGDCCEDDENSGFSCEWKVETVELPQPASFSEDPEAGADGAEEAVEGASDAATGAGSLGALGALSQIQSTDGAALGEGAGVGDLANLLGDSAPEGPGGMIQMALSLVYPNLKPMLEASIRKVTVIVKWKEGAKERAFSVVQYVTNPLEGSLNPNAAEGLDELMQAAGVGQDDGGTEAAK